MSSTFFVDWELWQQMSFFLASAIAVVMIAGVFRLQYLNWKSKRFELQDEEKHKRLSQVRKTGLRVRRDNEIPFGVRAIESGIEVDGIWISRAGTPVTPNEKRRMSVSTLVADDQGKMREKDVENARDLVDTSSPTHDFYRPRQLSSLRNESCTGDDDNTTLRVTDSNVNRDSLAAETYVPRQQQHHHHQPQAQQQQQQQQQYHRQTPHSQRTSGSSENSQYGNTYVPTYQATQPSRPAREDSPPRASSPGHPGRTSDSFNNTDTGMSHPSRTFVPGQQTRR